MTLTDFLLARIAEDEERSIDMDCQCPDDRDRFPDCPDRVLVECETKRLMVLEADRVAKAVHHWIEFDAEGVSSGLAGDLADLVLTQLAQPYADHPDYREEWKL